MAEYIDFEKLWISLKAASEIGGNERLKSVLLNHERNPEYILRKLGVVSDADVGRMISQMKSKL